MGCARQGSMLNICEVMTLVHVAAWCAWTLGMCARSFSELHPCIRVVLCGCISHHSTSLMQAQSFDVRMTPPANWCASMWSSRVTCPLSSFSIASRTSSERKPSKLETLFNNVRTGCHRRCSRIRILHSDGPSL